MGARGRGGAVVGVGSGQWKKGREGERAGGFSELEGFAVLGGELWGSKG